MIENINDFEDNTEFNADICIIGAGAAGITLALEFNNSSKKIVLLEAGGLDFPTKEEGLDIYSGESTGRKYDIQNSRLRYFGGTTNHWGGWCRPLDSVDFQAKPSSDNSGWPITRDELMPFYKKAAKVCELENYENYENLKQTEDKSVLNLSNSKVLQNKYFIFSPPTRFGSRYRQEVKNSKNITCYLYANATDLIIKEGVAKGVQVKSLHKKKFKVRANKVIVALGGMETTRFLLLNSIENKENGIANQNKLIGKYFMDHPGISPGNYLLQSQLKYYRHLSDKGVIMPFVSFMDKVLSNQNVMNLAIFFNPQKENPTLKNNYLSNPFLQTKNNGSNYSYQAIYEPTPYIKSTLKLSNNLDELKQRKIQLNWKIDPEDFNRVEKAFVLIAKELASLGLGRAKFNDNYLENSKKSLGYGMHHMGTTRMGTSKTTSVTDSYGELHEIKNLYVAGSSLFPNVGFSNPTLTIVALCIRLAEKLLKESK